MSICRLKEMLLNNNGRQTVAYGDRKTNLSTQRTAKVSTAPQPQIQPVAGTTLLISKIPCLLPQRHPSGRKRRRRTGGHARRMHIPSRKSGAKRRSRRRRKPSHLVKVCSRAIPQPNFRRTLRVACTLIKFGKQTNRSSCPQQTRKTSLSTSFERQRALYDMFSPLEHTCMLAIIDKHMRILMRNHSIMLTSTSRSPPPCSSSSRASC